MTDPVIINSGGSDPNHIEQLNNMTLNPSWCL